MTGLHTRMLGALLIGATLILSACASTGGGRQFAVGYTERGDASWYGPGFHGRRTANGEIYDQEAMTAAHRYLPFGTLVEVKRRDTGQRILVRINDRGPFVNDRIIDLSREGARRLESIGSGVVPVRLRIVRMPTWEEQQYKRAAGPYTIQLGVFRTADAARKLVRQVAGHLNEVRLVPADRFGSTRVLYGTFVNYDDATRNAERIRGSVVRDAFVVPDPMSTAN
ncbi:MAG: septal ring lytic transglycosylase RlpA family protein [Nitrospirota bacterium]|nr:septal ring lytic transglycosylase RlpA family protein [Nitrospirota bacterium]